MPESFSAIARSVMISAIYAQGTADDNSFSAIARSVMISAFPWLLEIFCGAVSVL